MFKMKIQQKNGRMLIDLCCPVLQFSAGFGTSTETMISGRRSDNSQTEFPFPQRRNKQEEMIEFEEKK